MNHHLLLLSLGPVQSFIAQARKLKDLRSGSQLLSELTKAACSTFLAAGGQVIVPGNPASDSLPNRLLGTISDKSDTEVVAIAKDVEVAVHKYWKETVAATKEKLPTHGGSADWRARFDEQVNQLLEVYWAIEPYAGDSDYVRAYQAIEQRLGSVKNVRTFAQIGSSFDGDETSRKDALTGERDALLFGAGKSKTRSGWPATVDDTLPRRMRERGPLVGPGEGLSAVSAVKRLRTLKEQDFASTADIALLGMLRKLSKDVLDPNYKVSAIRWVSNGGDAQLAYSENLTPKYFESQGLDTEDIKTVKEKHKQFQASVRAADPPLKQTSYYAVLAFDGDKMGEWLSGSKLGDSVDGATLRRFHSAIGTQLASFAKAAKDIVDNAGHGLTVYAGGDDYLGMLTLDSVFEVLGSLRAEFKAVVSDQLLDQFPQIGDQELTFSVGLVIAHYKRPLGDTVQMAQAAEKAAKNGGRNALCIRVVKRSGEQQEVVLPWQRKGADMAALDAIHSLVAALQGSTGRTWLTESARTITGLYGKQALTDSDVNLILPELRRLVRRAFRFGQEEDADTKRTQALAALNELVKLTTVEPEGKPVAAGARNLVFALQVIDFLKREMNDLTVTTKLETVES